MGIMIRQHSTLILAAMSQNIHTLPLISYKNFPYFAVQRAIRMYVAYIQLTCLLSSGLSAIFFCVSRQNMRSLTWSCSSFISSSFCRIVSSIFFSSNPTRSFHSFWLSERHLFIYKQKVSWGIKNHFGYLLQKISCMRLTSLSSLRSAVALAIFVCSCAIFFSPAFFSLSSSFIFSSSASFSPTAVRQRSSTADSYDSKMWNKIESCKKDEGWISG